ncbi:MAG: hypothetical protein WAW36_01120 [Methylovulum miyakonense]|uniref:hypothetical protein n=1 Tax=Methylovulum miyakonense TaxID=645578 RepID=UPI003BB49F58
MDKSNKTLPTDIKHKFRQRNMTMKSWGKQYGYTLRQVSDVVRGVNKAEYGTGREIAEKLIDDFSEVKV